MKVLTVFDSVPALCAMFAFLVAYSICVALMFRVGKDGRRRRWHVLDFVWIPMGGLTGIFLVALWWVMR